MTLSSRGRLERLIWLFLIVLLTAVTQVGGIILWLVLIWREWNRSVSREALVGYVSAFAVLYCLTSLVILPRVAPLFGRVPLACTATEHNYRAASSFYCLANRNYVRPQVKKAVEAIGKELGGAEFVVYLDAGFPFFNGFPLLPHLSHRDGREIDLALFYRDENGSMVSPAWPIGYWVFAPVGRLDRDCGLRSGPLRWSMSGLQPAFNGLRLDDAATARLVRSALDVPSVRRVLISPSLRRRLGVSDDRLRFEGCRAARHDDHIHLDIR